MTNVSRITASELKAQVLEDIKPYGYTLKDFVNTPREFLETLELQDLHLMTADVIKKILDLEEEEQSGKE